MRLGLKQCVVAGLAATVIAGFGPVAGAAPTATVPPPLADGLAGPLQIDVAPNGNVLVGQDFGGKLSLVGRAGGVADLLSASAEIAGVANGLFGIKLYTYWPMAAPAPGEDPVPSGDAELRYLDRRGNEHTLADLTAYEANHNPDSFQHYGLQGDVPAECTAGWPVEQAGPPSYDGGVDSHPYALASTVFGTFVADAAGNDILFVDPLGHISTVAVLPPVPQTITAELAGGFGLPDACIGLTYNFEGVPTDVEIGPGLSLYVSSLAGGEIPGNGSVRKINPFTGKVSMVGGGLNQATNVAVGPGGAVYAAELGANRISRVTANGPVPVADLNQPAALEWANGKLYATSDVFGSGKVVTLTP